MSCSVAIPSSPVFSPSRRPLSCKAASASPESVSVSSPAPSTAGSPLRPFGLLRAQIREEASPSPKTSSAASSVAAGSVLKRRRPAPLMVPVDGAAAAAAAAAAVAAVESDPSNEVEEEGDEFAAYCRRGRGRRRVEMEDRHVAKVALGGDPELVKARSMQLLFSFMNLLAQFYQIHTFDLPEPRMEIPSVLSKINLLEILSFLVYPQLCRRCLLYLTATAERTRQSSLPKICPSSWQRR